MTLVRREIGSLASRYLDGSPMYPGKYAFTWVLIFGVWHLVNLEPAT